MTLSMAITLSHLNSEWLSLPSAEATRLLQCKQNAYSLRVSGLNCHIPAANYTNMSPTEPESPVCDSAIIHAAAS